MQVKVQLNIDCTVHLVSQVHMSSSLLYFSFFTVLDLQGRRLSACSWTRAAPARSLPEPAIAHAVLRRNAAALESCRRSRKNAKQKIR